MLNLLAATLLFVSFSWCTQAQTSNEHTQEPSFYDTLFQATSPPDTSVGRNINKLDSLQLHAKASFDDLKSSYDSITSIADNASSTLQQQIDELNSLNLSTHKLTNKLDSIAQWKNDQLRAVDDKLQRLKTKVNEQINSLDLPDEVKAKTSAFTSEIDKLDISLPGAAFPQLELPNNLPGVDGLDNPLSGLTADLPDIDIDGANLGEVTDQVNKYTNTVTDVIPESIDDIPSTLETHATDALQIEGIQEQIGAVTELSEKAGQLGNEAYVQEQLKNEVQRQAFDHFAGKQEQLEKAMETMSKYKRKYEDIQSVAGLPKKKPNAMRGKPFVERLVPGVALQIHREDVWLFDVNPYIGYRLSGRLTTGLGWNQRIAYNFDEGKFRNSQMIFGPRLYGEFLIAKGFSARLEAESMKTQVPSQFSSGQTDEKGREWVFSTMAGIKKNYHFLKGVRGTAMLLYNLYDPQHRSPYLDKLNVRFGFEFPIKKRLTSPGPPVK